MPWQLEINRQKPSVALSRPWDTPVRVWFGLQASRLQASLDLPAGRSLCSKKLAHRLWLMAATFDLEDSNMHTAALRQPATPIPGAADQTIAHTLRNHGISPTAQRLLVARILFAGPREHLTAEQILARVRQQGGGCSRATVYNTLSLFAARGLIKALSINSECTLYDSDTTPHAHLYDVDNGQIADLPIKHLLQRCKAALPAGTELLDVNLVLQVRRGQA